MTRRIQMIKISVAKQVVANVKQTDRQSDSHFIYIKPRIENKRIDKNTSFLVEMGVTFFTSPLIVFFCSLFQFFFSLSLDLLTFARASAPSLPWIRQWESIHCRMTVLTSKMFCFSKSETIQTYIDICIIIIHKFIFYIQGK